MRFIKKYVALVMATIMIIGLVPVNTEAETPSDLGKITVIVENTTFPEGSWSGQLLNQEIALNSESTMASCVESAIESNGSTQSWSWGMLTEIDNLSNQGGTTSGWSMTINDWFTNVGAGDIKTSDGGLVDGDVVRVMYSRNWGSDLGSVMTTDKRLSNVSFTKGRLDTPFDAGTYSNILYINQACDLTVNATAISKNYQVKTTVNDTAVQYNQQVSVEDGDVIEVTCGDVSWPTMNAGPWGCQAELSPGKVYSYTVSVNSEKAVTPSSIEIYTGTNTWTRTALLQSIGGYSQTAAIFDADKLSYTLPDQLDSQKSLAFYGNIPEGTVAKLSYNSSSETLDLSDGKGAVSNCLKPGRNELELQLVPQEGSTDVASTYHFTVDCVPTLSGLVVSENNKELFFNKKYSMNDYSYRLPIDNKATTVEVSAVPTSEDYVVTYNGLASNVVDISSAYTNSVTVQVKPTETEANVIASYTIYLQKAPLETLTFNVTPSNATIKVVDSHGNTIVPNEDGEYTGLFSVENYTYTVSAYDYATQSGIIQTGVNEIETSLKKIDAITVDDIESQWGSFRNSVENSGVVNTRTPLDQTTTELKWATQLSINYAGLSDPIMVDGNLYAMCGSELLQLDAGTGKVTNKVTMAASLDYTAGKLAYGEGKIFCPISNGMIQAFDAKTMKSLWVYHDLIGGQALSPITYHNGYIYTGFWNGDSSDANYVCISASDEDKTSETEEKYNTWSYKSLGGFYWDGGVVVNDYIIVGSGNESSNSSEHTTDPSKLLVFNKKTGAVVSSINISGDVYSTVVFNTDRSELYVVSKAGIFYKVGFNGNTGMLGAVSTCILQGASTATPIIYNGVAYVGVQNGWIGGYLDAIDLGTMKIISSAALKGYPQGSMLLSTKYLNQTGKLYLYSTYNSMPGGVSMVSVNADGTSPKVTEIYEAKGYENYCTSSMITDNYGTLYYCNDSGNLLCIEDGVQVSLAHAEEQQNNTITTPHKPLTPVKSSYFGAVLPTSSVSKMESMEVAENIGEIDKDENMEDTDNAVESVVTNDDSSDEVVVPDKQSETSTIENDKKASGIPIVGWVVIIVGGLTIVGGIVVVLKRKK